MTCVRRSTSSQLDTQTSEAGHVRVNRTHMMGFMISAGFSSLGTTSWIENTPACSDNEDALSLDTDRGDGEVYEDVP